MKKINAFSLLICLFLLSGCWDQKELNELVLINGIGIDQAEDGQVEVTVSIAVPKANSSAGGGEIAGGGGGAGGGTYMILTRHAKAPTITKAFDQLQTQIPRKIFLGHLRAIVFSEKVAEKGIKDHFDVFLRHRGPSTNTFVFISKGSAKELLALQTELYSPVDIMVNIARTDTLMKTTVLDVYQMLKKRDTAIPMIEKLPAEKGKKPNQTIPFLNHTAIFNKDKMIGSLDDYLTRGAMWVRNEIEEDRIMWKPENEDEPIVLNVLNANTKFVPEIKGDKWSIMIKGSASGVIISSESELNVKDKKTIDTLEKEFAKEIEKKMASTVKYVQKDKKIRIFEFGEAFNRKYPKRWNKDKDRWEEIYPTVEVKYDMKVNIRSSGVGTVH
ncbi:Ger(x)C family spore germination protein [Bacillus benzoevorans]|uniref:Spore germination protein KC n=1 Tax=Bacillus benzoevorans TaxID=1456 RepID=A0A7X0LXM0_9BACI|nr:Ger(x)C family spore germination protein [Bacillus benzoevorans]MBB6446564.1 spore germination protein KC [Bacillus benzoevorans]